MSELEVETRELDDIVLLYPQGFINAHTVRVFEGEIQKALEKRRFKIVALTAFAAVAVPVAAMSATEAAATERTDNAFVDRVSDMGIGFTSRQTVINAGHSICQALGDGETPASAIQHFGHRTHLTATQATGFVAAAVQTYCG